jgi:phosphonate transport system permease protein
VRSYFARLARPDLSARTLGEAASGAVVPLALGWLGTVLGSLGAAALAYPMSARFQLGARAFTGERAGAAALAARWTLFAAARAAALVLRSIPEVAWVLVLAAFFRIGVLPGMLALAAHSAGVLARVFAEAIDGVPERQLEATFQGSRFGAFLYGALPRSLRSWKSYALFQLEVNVRSGLVLGMIGVGGLGDLFDSSRVHWAPERMSTFALAMVLLTVGIDRLSRRWG